MQFHWQKNYKGLVAKCAFVTKSLRRERDEGKKSQEYTEYLSRFFAESQPRRSDYSRNDIRQQAHKVFAVCLFGLLMAWGAVLAQSSVLDLNSDIRARKKEQQELQRKINEYQQQIRAAQRKTATLSNQINILDANIGKTRLEINAKELEAIQLALETTLVERQILEEEGRIVSTHDDIGRMLREMRRFDDQGPVEVILARATLSEFFDQIFYSTRLLGTLRERLIDIQTIRDILTRNRELLNQKKTDAEQKLGELSVLKDTFEDERRVKDALFGKTRATEEEFQALLKDLRAAAAALDSEIVTIEKKIRERLDIADKLAGDTGVLSWPVPPIGGISAGFHDPDYPFRYLFEHNGIDIRTPQGTPVRAAASGYIAKAYNGGLGIQPSYVMLLHNNNLTTVYMHLSAINVAPDTFLARGDVVGRSGGAPKTSGAGRWSTGPHLHFETRLKGVPVNPIGYLP
ncbi:peptidoglycan DD-metalloendopeptidase family protein [Candidatus Uhrbacteria bacterium]|nr:peptidoglycan DD-metalloendopeptidase family protein [Candidatus Uhrbacteria bacterium]